LVVADDPPSVFWVRFVAQKKKLQTMTFSWCQLCLAW